MITIVPQTVSCFLWVSPLLVAFFALFASTKSLLHTNMLYAFSEIRTRIFESHQGTPFKRLQNVEQVPTFANRCKGRLPLTSC